MKELESSIVIRVRHSVDVGSHVVYYYSEPLEHVIGRLAGEMSEVLVLSPVSLEQA